LKPIKIQFEASGVPTIFLHFRRWVWSRATAAMCDELHERPTETEKGENIIGFLFFISFVILYFL
jgi:hypothetical protein